MKKQPLDVENFDISLCKTRLAQPRDASDLVAIAKTIWGGEDYLLKVLTAWINEPWFIVCEYQGVVVACIKLTQLPPNTLWFEGMRVLKPLQGKGLGKLMNKAAMELALQISNQQPGMLFEFSTYFMNQETPHLTSKLGFKQVAGFHIMDKYGGRILEEPEPVENPGMDIFDHYPAYLPVGWKAIRKSEEGLEYIRQNARIYASPGMRFLIGGIENTDVTLIDPIPANLQKELPYIQYHIGYKRNFSIIFPQTYPSVIFSLECQKFRVRDHNPENVPEILVFSRSAEL